MATIREIAELAGVSRGTVDRVLNHRGSVNAATAALVNDIAKKLDYKPNRAGIALAAQRKMVRIGVVLFDTGNPFFDEVWNSVLSKEEELNSYNCSVLKKKTGFSAQEQLQAIAELEAEGIDGLVISPFNDTAVANKIDQLQSRQIPVITTNTDIRNSSRLAFVGSDFYRCGQTDESHDLRGSARRYRHRFLPGALSYRPDCRFLRPDLCLLSAYPGHRRD